ncbi:MAG TPA: hypothetical protein PKD91_02655 [Bacteroidia bacterium]|nr:hypothetical protein [Bacteroidia bacterium]
MASQQDFTLFVIVIALSFLIMSAFLIGILLHIYRQRVVNQNNMLNAMFQVQEREKASITEDFEDNLGTSLSALRFMIDEISRESTDPNAAKIAREGLTYLDTVIGDLRYLVRSQSSKYLISYGFEQEFRRYSHWISKDKKLEFNFSISEKLPSLDNSFGVNLFRIVQELVTNSYKRSNSTSINLDIGKENDQLVLNYSDNRTSASVVEDQVLDILKENLDARIKLFKGKFLFDNHNENQSKYQIYFDLKEVK